MLYCPRFVRKCDFAHKLLSDRNFTTSVAHLIAMKAVILTGTGPPSTLRYREDYPLPARKPGEVLVRINAAAINPIEFKIRRGDIPLPSFLLPKILGADMSGVVEEADNTSKFKKGDRVFAHASGTYAEYASIREQLLLPIPANISFEEAAAVPLAGMTAWQSLPPPAMRAGKRVLIHAGSGGVGSFAIQIAKAYGMHVTTTCSGRNVELVKSLGADEVVDYTKDDFVALYKDKPFDAIVDSLGGATYFKCLKVIKPNGYLASILTGYGAPGYPKPIGLFVTFSDILYRKALSVVCRGPTVKSVLLTPKPSDLAELAKLMEAGKLKPAIDQVYPLSEAAKAHEYLESGHARGKVILKPDGVTQTAATETATTAATQ